MIGVGSGQGRPSQAALGLRKWLMAAVIIMLGLAITQLFYPPGAARVSLGVWGILTSLLGFFCVRNNSIDMMSITMFGMFCFTQSITYLITVLDIVINSSGFFRSGSSKTEIIAQSIMLACLTIYTTSVVLSWFIFTAAEPGYTAIGSMSGTNNRSYGAVDNRPAPSGFVPFSGGSRKVGSN